MTISILTLFPEMFSSPFAYSIIKNAIAEKKVKINFVDIRDYGIGKHKSVDDKPYGGGLGMVIRVDVLAKAIENAKNKTLKKDEQKVILLDPHGKTLNQKKAEQLSKLKHLILVCGHYEGVDERIEKFIDEKISIGDFIVTGGEIPVMLVADTVIRLLPGVLKKGVTDTESFSDYLEYPQYTRPQEYKKLTVPKVLLSGNHAEIDNWRKNQSLKITKKLRPDLLRKPSKKD
ncbi:MAG: tRNA (guanosine(37)-N1)-methyltransferase TrmD [Candidatus Levybacteria bacterium]|nr:tRNA (guanosine(37)-N1)-methyltransferase TrmD [Candidatus Levybacteria bacterium]